MKDAIIAVPVIIAIMIGLPMLLLWLRDRGGILDVLIRKATGLLSLLMGLTIIGWVIFNLFAPTKEFQASYRTVFQFFVPCAMVWFGWKWLANGGAGDSKQDDAVVSVPDDDQEMNAAIQEARDTLLSFVEELKKPSSGDRHLLVKVRLVQGDISEHMWVADLTAGSNVFQGVLADEPQAISGLRFKEPVTVPFDQISDWMIVQDGKVKGAFTTRVLRNRTTADDLNDEPHIGLP